MEFNIPIFSPVRPSACVEIWSRQEVGTGVDRQLGIAHIDHGSLDNMTFKKRLTKGGRVGLITNYISNSILTTLITLTTGISDDPNQGINIS